MKPVKHKFATLTQKIDDRRYVQVGYCLEKDQWIIRGNTKGQRRGGIALTDEAMSSVMQLYLNILVAKQKGELPK